MKQELADECDYAREAGFLRAFGAPDHLGGDERFRVPWVWDGSTDRVLVMEHVGGTSVGDADISRLDQRDRNDVRTILLLASTCPSSLTWIGCRSPPGSSSSA